MPRCGPWNFSVAISWIGICWATFYTRFESSIWDNGNALQHHIASTQSKIEELANYTRHRNPAKSDHCLVLSVTESVSQSLLLLNFVQIGFVKVIRWICQNWYMIFSDFLHIFVIIDTSYMDFSKLLQEFVKIDSIEKFLLFLILFKLDLSKLLHVFLLLLIDTWISLSC